jgi:Arc/MetJ-type ribon-helix-helix transcriptional regulator
VNISVTPELERFVAEQVASGRYSSASKVVREALRLLEESNQLQPPAPGDYELSQPPTSSVRSGEHIKANVTLDSASYGNLDVERWLNEEVAPVYDRMKASPERAIPAENVFSAVRRRHAEQRKRSS